MSKHLHDQFHCHDVAVAGWCNVAGTCLAHVHEVGTSPSFWIIYLCIFSDVNIELNRQPGNEATINHVHD